jgi:hypothetical protein
VNGHRVEIALRACADGQLVFTALAGQQRPAASVRDAGPASVGSHSDPSALFAVSIETRAVPERPVGVGVAQLLIHDGERIERCAGRPDVTRRGGPARGSSAR